MGSEVYGAGGTPRFGEMHILACKTWGGTNKKPSNMREKAMRFGLFVLFYLWLIPFLAFQFFVLSAHFKEPNTGAPSWGEK